MTTRRSNNDANDAPAVDDPSIPPELSKKLIQFCKPDASKKVPNDTAKAVSEVLRMFVIEARARASIEAECDNEGEIEDDDDSPEMNAANDLVPIRADHITKIAAELLMDFS